MTELRKYQHPITPHPAQETQELIGMLSDAVSELALRAARDEVAMSVLRQIGAEVHALIADARAVGEGEQS